MHRPGAVYRVPAHLSLSGDPKARPMVLAHSCTEGQDAFASLQYASSQETQAALGATSVVLEPRTGRGGSNGFSQRTWIFPGLLVPVPVAQLDRPLGQLSMADLALVAAALGIALGVGSGTCWTNPTGWQLRGPVYHAGGPGRSLRGRLVTFASELLALLRGGTREEDVRFGIVISPHGVSAHPEAYQTVVPVVGEFAATQPDEMHVEGETWVDDVEQGADAALVLVPQAFYVHPSALRRTAYERVVTASTMRRIETALLERLQRRP